MTSLPVSLRLQTIGVKGHSRKGPDGRRDNENLDRQGLAFSHRRSWASKKPSCVRFLQSPQDNGNQAFSENGKYWLSSYFQRTYLPAAALKDVLLNKPFKDRVRKKRMSWMAEGIHELTAMGRQKKPSEELMSVDQQGVEWHSPRNGCDIILKVRHHQFLGWFRGWFCLWLFVRWWIFWRWRSFGGTFCIWLKVTLWRILRKGPVVWDWNILDRKLSVSQSFALELLFI